LKKKEKIVYPCTKFPILEGSRARGHLKKKRNGRNLPLREADGEGPGSGVRRRAGTDLEK
jgi:hypothetical protein